MPYIPNTDEERKQMLEKIGVHSFEELIQAIPEKLRLKKPLNLTSPLSELELTQLVNLLATRILIPKSLVASSEQVFMTILFLQQ